MGNKVGFGVEVDDNGAVRKLKAVAAAFDKIGGKGTGASLFGNVTAKAVASGFNLIGDAAVAVVDVLGDAIQMGIAEEESIAKLDTALEANVKAWDGNREAIEGVLQARMALGFSDDEQRESLALLVAATNDVNRALEIQRTAMDLARFKGISLQAATEALTRVEGGQYRILKSLGIVLQEGATAQDALNAVQAVATGQAEAYANTTGGKLLVAQTKVGEALERLGTVLLPLVAGAMTALADIAVPAIEAIVGVVSRLIRGLERAIGLIQDAIGWAGELADSLRVTDENPFGLLSQSPPGHATGGWVGLNGPEMGIVGENGPEFITPTHQAVNGSGGGITIEGVSAKDLARIIDEQLYVKLRRAAPTAGRI